MRAAALTLFFVLLPGCISVDVAGGGSKPDLHRHTIDAAAGVTQRPRTLPSLAVRPFGARSRYDIRVVRREGADSVAYLEFERWAEPPADAAADAVRESLAASGAFAAVSASVDALRVERSLDGYVLAFELVKTPSGPWRARFAARLSMSDRDGNLLASAVYEGKADLPGEGPAGLGRAMSAAIGEAVNAALNDWTKAAK